MTAGHGVNVGHGYLKYLIIDERGDELPPQLFPAMIARAGRTVQGALHQVETVDAGGGQWWIGDDALRSDTPVTLLAQDRLTDPVFIPALLRGALKRFGDLNGAASGICVTGLPATWALDKSKAQALGARLRDAAGGAYTRIKVIPEPLGAIYALLLDTDGQIDGDATLQHGRIGIIDLGHYTVDLAIVDRLVPVASSLQTFALGSAEPLGKIRALLSAAYERELSLYDTDQAIRAGSIRVAGQARDLPPGWDRPLIDTGQAIVARLSEAWKAGGDLDLILLAGGGAELEPVTTAICRRFPHAEVIADPQLAIASGYARLARKLGREAA